MHISIFSYFKSIQVSNNLNTYQCTIGHLWNTMATFTSECVFSGSAVPYDSFKLRQPPQSVLGSCCTITKSESSTKKFVSFTQLFSIIFLVKSQHFKNIRQNIVSQKLSLIAYLSICVSFIQFCNEKFSSKSISIFFIT